MGRVAGEDGLSQGKIRLDQPASRAVVLTKLGLKNIYESFLLYVWVIMITTFVMVFLI